MIHVALDSKIGKPLSVKLVWSALLDAPITESRTCSARVSVWVRAAAMVRRGRRSNILAPLWRRGSTRSEVTCGSRKASSFIFRPLRPGLCSDGEQVRGAADAFTSPGCHYEANSTARWILEP
jgi:hypothetical protein